MEQCRCEGDLAKPGACFNLLALHAAMAPYDQTMFTFGLSSPTDSQHHHYNSPLATKSPDWWALALLQQRADLEPDTNQPYRTDIITNGQCMFVPYGKHCRSQVCGGSSYRLRLDYELLMTINRLFIGRTVQ